MVSRSNIRLGELLIERGVIDRDQLNAALMVQSKSEKRLGQTLVSLGYANEKAILSALTQIAVQDKVRHEPDDAPRYAGISLLKWKIGLLCSAFVLSLSAYAIYINRDTSNESVAIVSESSTPGEASPVSLEPSAPESLGVVEVVGRPQAVLSNLEPEALIEDTDTEEDATSDVDSSVDAVFEAEAVEDVLTDNVELEPFDTVIAAPSLEPPVEAEVFAPSLYETDTSVVAALASISDVRSNINKSDMRIVFESQTSIAPSVERIYLNDTEVMYVFKGFELADSVGQGPNLTDNDWLEKSYFEQSDGTMVWAFTMASPGSAKYHELAPTPDGNYRFVVIVRKE